MCPYHDVVAMCLGDAFVFSVARFVCGVSRCTGLRSDLWTCFFKFCLGRGKNRFVSVAGSYVQ